ncbi:uncharacterized protein LOC143025923 [Oratosquilla oratoria]|uniref:uncharacterized protein LOC143025923 n=1 Tax=Oratosquilla oratoria TaxID=337810 RepID=UPI003F760E69
MVSAILKTKIMEIPTTRAALHLWAYVLSGEILPRADTAFQLKRLAWHRGETKENFVRDIASNAPGGARSGLEGTGREPSAGSRRTCNGAKKDWRDGTQCFAHGQLYVACSRVTSWDSLYYYTGWKKVKDSECRRLPTNVVYKELFFAQDVPVEPEQQSRVVTEHSDDAAIAEEEPDQSMVVIPPISEKEAIDMVLPDYTYDSEEDEKPTTPESTVKEEIEAMQRKLKHKLDNINEAVNKLLEASGEEPTQEGRSLAPKRRREGDETEVEYIKRVKIDDKADSDK